jgi:O-methyltransferase
MRFLRDRTIHSCFLALKRLHYGEFYLQWRPAEELRSQRMQVASEIVREWCSADVGLGQDCSRVYMLVMNILRLNEQAIPGAFAEVGVYKGYTARILARLAGQRPVYLFDTFSGFDPSDLRREGVVNAGYRPPESFEDTSVEGVKRTLGRAPHVVFCVGHFPGSTTQLATSTRFALVHFDADLYEPAKSACEFFYPRMSPGGMLIFHNYNDPDYPGTRRAVDEFFSDKPESLVAIPDQYGSAVVTRSKSAAGEG